MTSEAKFTPGPWRGGHLIDDSHSCNCRFIFAEDDRMGCVATVAIADDCEHAKGFDFRGEYPDREEAKANMRLIAAAPELLASLKETLAVAIRNEEGEFADRARAAIAKATGD